MSRVEEREFAVAVVIPTFNRAALLVTCLEHVARQRLDRARFEVVVVSDGSTDDTVAAARAAGARLGLALRVVEGEHGGPGQARNLGIASANAPLVAFTDDDVRVDPDWLLLGIVPFADPTVGGVEGRTLAETGAESLFKFNVSNLAGGRYPTCNMFYRRSALDAVGGFDVRFRRAREDSDLAFRIQASGLRLVFVPEVLAVHRAHRGSPTTPLFIASTLPDSILLWSKHPGRDTLRPKFYRSDAVKIALAALAVVALIGGWRAPAVGFAAAFGLLVARRMWRELVPRRAVRPDRLAVLCGVYALLPFAQLYYFVVGHRRIARGDGPTTPI